MAFLLVLALLVWLSVALYQKKFTPVAMVTLYTSSAGNEMHPGAQVMVRGVQVGEVRQITAQGTGARLELAIEPGQLPMLPANVSAQMLPTTLFGERYVDLILPSTPTVARLTSGSVIQQDRSADAIELDQVLGNLLPMLAATQPDKLSMALTAIAQGLQGQGHALGQALVTLNSYLEKLNPQLPQIDTDITKLAALARTYNRGSPGHPAGSQRLRRHRPDASEPARELRRVAGQPHHLVRRPDSLPGCELGERDHAVRRQPVHAEHPGPVRAGVPVRAAAAG